MPIDLALFPREMIHRFEVLSVHINNTKDDDESTLSPADIIGDIFLIENCSRRSVKGVELFARKKRDYDSFQPGIDTELLLTGPCIGQEMEPCFGFNYICFALFDYPPEDEEEDLKDICMPYSAIDMFINRPAVEEISKWIITRPYNEKTDIIQSRTVFGEYGSVTMDYIVYSIPTVEAIVEIMVILKDAAATHQDDVVVDGRITAHNTLYEKKEILLFRSHKGKHVKHGQLIPLSKSCLVLPFKSSLIIGTYLSIANRYAKFCVPKYPGTSKRMVSGKRCKMLIQVIWSNYS